MVGGVIMNSDKHIHDELLSSIPTSSSRGISDFTTVNIYCLEKVGEDINSFFPDFHESKINSTKNK